MTSTASSSPQSRSGHRLALLWLMALAPLVILASCGDSTPEPDAAAEPTAGSEADPEESQATESETSTTEPTAATESTASDPAAATEDGGPRDPSGLQEAIDATISRTTASFTLNVTQILPTAAPNDAAMLRSGSFDDDLAVGIGTQQFLGETGASSDLPGLAGQQIEHRVVDNMYWLLNPVSDPPGWIGYDLTSFAELAQDDPTLAMNADLYLRVIGDAITEVTDVVDFGDGSEGWAVQLEADDLLPLVVTAGVQRRLNQAGLEPTGLEATATVAVDPDGMVVAFIADLNEWWQAVIDQTLTATDSPAGMSVQFEMGGFDAPVEVANPCSSPEEVLEPGFPPALVCDG